MQYSSTFVYAPNREDLSQEQLAELTELRRAYIGAVGRGERNISMVNILKIARALRMNLPDLLRETVRQLRR